MIHYNVTVSLDESRVEEWLDWMQREHIPEVMATGRFESYRLLKLLNEVEGSEGCTFAVQYRCASLDTFNAYMEEESPGLRQKTEERFGGQFAAFRTLLEEVATDEER